MMAAASSFDPQVGSVNNTFGIKGVQEHCMLFKTIQDANNLRRRISECFERASLPHVSDSCHMHCCRRHGRHVLMIQPY